MKQILLIFSFLFISLTGTYAQVTTSNLSGRVLDENGAELPGANIVAVHTPTGTKYGAITNFDGKYRIVNMRIGGPYTVTISFVGFEDNVTTGVHLQLGQTFNINKQLSTSSTQLGEILITGRKNDVFNDGRTGSETSVGRRELTMLPTISRSAADFTRLEPSASSNGSFGGRNDQFNNISLDGSIFNNPFGLDASTAGGQTMAQPISLDAIEQIQVSSAPYDVTQSGFTGASVNAVTKSGTNTFKGTAYFFDRNDGLTGDKIKGKSISVPKLEQTQWGISFGGPIIKDKLFFFANFESDDRDDAGSNWVPSTGGSPTGNQSRVTLSDMQAVQGILSQVVIGQDAQGNNIFYNPGAIQGFTHKSESIKGIFKLDWNINDNNRLSFIYNFLDASKEKPAHPTALGFRGPSATTLQFENAGYQINNELNSILVELNSTLSNNVSNKFQFGYTKFTDFRNPFSTPAPTITILDETGSSNYIIAGHEPFSINNRLDQEVFQLTNNLNVISGNHNFTFGFSFEKFKFANSFNLGVYGARGVFFPTGTINDFRDPSKEAASVADYQDQFNAAIAADAGLSSIPAGQKGGFNLNKLNVGQLSFYLQDSWDVNDNFKLTYGIRFDKPLYFNTSELAQEFIDTQCCSKPDDVFFDDANNPITFDNTKLPTDKILVSPRVGFNWDVKGDKSLQLRGGTGVFTGRLPFVWINNQIGSPNFFFRQVTDPDFQWPQVWRTSLGIDKKFESGIVASVDLAYTKDINGAHVQNFGLKDPTGQLQGVDNRLTFREEDKAVAAYGGSNSAFGFTNSDKGRTFNASFKLQKNFDNGLFATVAYNFLDSEDVNSIEAEITGDAFVGNAANNDVNTPVRSNSRYGDRHRIIAVAGKKFDYGDGKYATTISIFSEYAQGGRFSYTYGGDINNDGSNLNDLLYVPTSAEIGQMRFAEAVGGPTQDQQRQGLEAYIAQDDYLRGRRGAYAERYAALSPWRGRWDVKFCKTLILKFQKKEPIPFNLV